jgi:hypothetical protein
MDPLAPPVSPMRGIDLSTAPAQADRAAHAPAVSAIAGAFARTGVTRLIGSGGSSASTAATGVHYAGVTRDQAKEPKRFSVRSRDK